MGKFLLEFGNTVDRLGTDSMHILLLAGHACILATLVRAFTTKVHIYIFTSTT
jgi:hypothetical protein